MSVAQRTSASGLIGATSLRTCFRLALPALCCAVVVMGLFYDKAYTIDDPLYLRLAEQILAEPLNPLGFEESWEHEHLAAGEVNSGTVGMGYALAPVVAAGAPEWLAHLFQFGFLAFGIVFATSFWLRLGATRPEARSAALLLVTAPAVLAMSTTAMPDIPAMALSIFGMERLLAYRDEGRTDRGLASAIGFGLATQFRFHTLLLIAIASLIFFANRQGHWRFERWRRAWPLAGALGLALTLALLTADPARVGGGIIERVTVLWDSESARHNTIAFFSHYVHVIPLAIPWLVIRYEKQLLWIFLILALAIGIFVLPAYHRHLWWAAPIAAVGATVLVDAFRLARERRSWLILALSCWLWIPLPIVVYSHLPAKYLTVCMPAACMLVILLVRELPRARRAVIGFTLVFGLVLGTLIIQADAHFSNLGRVGAMKLIAPRRAQGTRVWFNTSWGFQWYARRAGALPLTERPPHPVRGDFIVGNVRLDKALLARHRLVLVDTLADQTGLKGRIMGHGAGFYSSYWGYLPWTLHSSPADHFSVWEVQ